MLQFRKAILNDREQIFEMYMDEKANPYLTFDPMSEEAFIPLFDELLAAQTLFVATENDRVAGTFRLIPKFYREAHIVYLGSFVIDATMQGRGIGSACMNFIKSYSWSNGFKRIELTVVVDNEAAIRLYKKSGFEIEGIVKKGCFLVSTGLYYDEYLMAVLYE